MHTSAALARLVGLVTLAAAVTAGGSPARATVGTTIALNVHDPAAGIAQGASPAGLFVFDTSSGALNQLIAGESERLNLRWAPDGNWIASEDTDDFLVDVIRPDGGTPREVVSVEWSPSGSNVAYSTAKGLVVGPSDWSKASLVTRARGSDPLEWASGGDRFIFGSGRSSSCCWRSLRVSHATGTRVRTLWTPPSDGPDASWINHASWSPTGRQIAVDAIINNGVASRKGGAFLYLAVPGRRGANRVSYRPQGGGLVGWSGDDKWLLLSRGDGVFRLSPKGGRARPLCARPCVTQVSANRRRFAFATRTGTLGSSTSLWVANIDGSGKQQIAELPNTAPYLDDEALYFFWSPDGRRLGLTLPEPDGVHSSVAVIDLATRQIQQLTDGSHRDFVFGGLSSDGAFVAFGRVDDPDSPELWVVSTNSGEAERVMTFASDPDLGACPEVAWSPKAPLLAVTNAPCAPS